MTHSDLDILARTIWGEARGEHFEGKVAAGHVVLNSDTQKMILADKKSIIQDLKGDGEFDLVSKAELLTEDEIQEIGKLAAKYIGKGGYISKMIVLGAIEYFEGKYRVPKRKRRDMSYYKKRDN